MISQHAASSDLIHLSHCKLIIYQVNMENYAVYVRQKPYVLQKGVLEGHDLVKFCPSV